MKTDRFDIHQHITDKIVSAIEHGAGEFRLPWHRSTGNIMRPVNIASKKAYRGINVLALWATADEKGFSAGVWGTYRQWVRRVSRMKGVTLWVHEQCPALSPLPACRPGNGAV